MTADEILRQCLDRLEGTVLVESWGERGIFYNPGHALKRGVYLLTIKERDGANDRASQLDRPGIFRVNIGVRPDTYRTLFGPKPARPQAGGVVSLPCDFTVLDQLIPHPVYAWMGWVCILNPSEEAFQRTWPLVEEAHGYAREKFQKRKR